MATSKEPQPSKLMAAPPLSSTHDDRHLGICLLLAAALTAVAVAKPVIWDDVVYHDFARHILLHPRDPYGATIWINGRSADGMSVLAPALVLYWWAGAMAVFGTEVARAALGLFPLAIVYVLSLASLARRFAPGFAIPVTVAAALSPWPLVTISYMLDFPALALGLCALALFIRGVDARTHGPVVLAGVVAGLALQAKYNMAAIPAAMLLYGFYQRRMMSALLAGLIAGFVFVAWEWTLWIGYGQSHFLVHLARQSHNGGVGHFRDLLYGLVANIGPLCLWIVLIGSLVLGWRQRLSVALVVFALLAFVLAACGFDNLVGSLLAGISTPTLLTLSGLLGLAVFLSAAFLSSRLTRAPDVTARADARFLTGWFWIEIAMYLAMSPFPAARRLGGMTIVLMLLGGLAIARHERMSAIRWALPAAGVSAVTGIVMLAISLVDVFNVAHTVRRAADLMRSERAHTRWALAALNTAFYARQEGLTLIDLGRSQLGEGDTVLIEPPNLLTLLGIDDGRLERIALVRSGLNLGVTVSTDFYRNKLPWHPAADTRPEVAVFRVRAPTVLGR